MTRPVSLSRSDCFVFVQPFSLGDYGGGARILNSVCEQAPCRVASVCTGARANIPASSVPESLIRSRPSLGRIDRTRFAWLGGYIETLFAPSFRKKLTVELQRLSARAVHLVPHSCGDFSHAYQIARDLDLKVYVSIHDDFTYTAKTHPFIRHYLKQLGRVWREADGCFVISQEMGEEYSRRYGRRAYIIHTDGNRANTDLTYSPPKNHLNIYFMGLFNNPYRQNLAALVNGLNHLSSTSPGFSVNLRLRCGSLTLDSTKIPPWLEVLAFADQAVINREMRNAHLLYMPLPVDKEFADFYRFSLSTKMVSYLAAGVPILYHGPEDTAAAAYLRRNDAAIQIYSNDPVAIQRGIGQVLSQPDRLHQISRNALAAAARDFDPDVLRRRFWDGISGCLDRDAKVATL